MTRRRARGFSVAEALVAALLVSIVVACAGIVFQALGRRADRESGRTPGVGGMTDAALDRLERDLHLATSLPARSGRLSADGRTLLLRMGDGSLVTWRQEADVLLRGISDERRRLHERRVLDGVSLLDLRARSPLLFEVALRRSQEPLRRRTILLRNAGAPGSRDEDDDRGGGSGGQPGGAGADGWADGAPAASGSPGSGEGRP